MTEWERLSQVRHIDPNSGKLLSIETPRQIRLMDTFGTETAQRGRTRTPKKMYDHICEHCEKVFQSTHRVKHFCSVECMGNARRTNGHDQTCPICGKAFHVKSKKRVTCSRECGTIYNRRRRLAA